MPKKYSAPRSKGIPIGLFEGTPIFETPGIRADETSLRHFMDGGDAAFVDEIDDLGTFLVLRLDPHDRDPWPRRKHVHRFAPTMLKWPDTAPSVQAYRFQYGRRRRIAGILRTGEEGIFLDGTVADHSARFQILRIDAGHLIEALLRRELAEIEAGCAERARRRREEGR
jgi:hypothetical protein